MTPFNPEMGFFDRGRQTAYSWQDLQLATSLTGVSALTPSGATNQSYAFSLTSVFRVEDASGSGQEALQDARSDHVYPQELGTSYIHDALAQELHGALNLYNTNNSLYPYIGDASALGDWAFNESAVPSAGNSFFTPMPPQPNPFLTQPTYPVAGPGYAYQPIAPAAAAQSNIVVPPNLTSGAHVAAHRRTVETRIRCTADGCTKTFRRPGDYRRHMRKHQDSKLKCIVDDCDMKFYRLDKLRDHMRQGHKMVL